MKRLWIDIQGHLYDVWFIKSAEPREEYNDLRGAMDYLLVLNETADINEIRNKIFKFTDKDERDGVLFDLKEALTNSPGMYFVGETDMNIEMDEMNPDKKDDKKDDEEYDEEDFDDV